MQPPSEPCRALPCTRAQTAARGHITATNVAIITAVRIWIRYVRKAIIVPICIWPAPTRAPPNHTAATLETFNTSITLGNMKAWSRPARSELSVRSALATPKRCPSSGSRTNARMTRMPWICSRRTWFARSMRACMFSNCGISRMTTRPTLMTSAGMATTRINESGPSSRIARIKPPTIMIGAATKSVHIITTSICTCWTSLVMRVMSDEAPKVFTSAAENAVTPRNSAPRTSRPKLIAARAPK